MDCVLVTLLQSSELHICFCGGMNSLHKNVLIVNELIRFELHQNQLQSNETSTLGCTIYSRLSTGHWDQLAQHLNFCLLYQQLRKKTDTYTNRLQVSVKRKLPVLYATQHELRHMQCTILFKCVYLLYTSEYTVHKKKYQRNSIHACTRIHYLLNGSIIECFHLLKKKKRS